MDKEPQRLKKLEISNGNHPNKNEYSIEDKYTSKHSSFKLISRKEAIFKKCSCLKNSRQAQESSTQDKPILSIGIVTNAHNCLGSKNRSLKSM